MSTAQEDARTAYEVAAGLYMDENQVTWDRFNVMLVANSIVLAAAGSAGAKDNLFLDVVEWLPVLGVPLCVAWALMMKRGFDYHDHWREYARRIECQLDLGENKPINGAKVRFRSRRRFLQARFFAYAVIGIFVALYIASWFYIRSRT